MVVPTYNRVERLRRVVSALAEQGDADDMEIVVVSDGSVDGTDRYLQAPDLPANVVAVKQDNAGPAAARNTGVEHARGEIVLFLDDDVVAAPGLVRAHADAHRRLGDDVVVIGPMLDPPDHPMSPWVRWEQRMLAKQYAAMQAGQYSATARQFYTGNASVRRRHLQAVGGFDPRFRRAEDVELAFRLRDAGLEFAFVPEAIGHHYAERSFDAWLANAYQYGRNDMVFGRDLGQRWVLEFVDAKRRQHHPLVRVAVAVFSPRPRLATALTIALRPAGRLAGRIGRAALSVMYAVEYYRGVFDEVGGSRELKELINRVRSTA